MSRTRKTRPLHVRMADPNDNGVGFIEAHNHVNGRECDLPEHADAKSIEEAGVTFIADNTKRPCHYSWTYKGSNICGCHMCTGHEENKIENRNERHETKEKLNEIKKTHNYENDEI